MEKSRTVQSTSAVPRNGIRSGIQAAKVSVTYHLSLAYPRAIIGINYKNDSLSSGHEIVPKPGSERKITVVLACR